MSRAPSLTDREAESFDAIVAAVTDNTITADDAMRQSQGES